eukprot:m.100284 g.100284  ORF g.100284 m.100284 type:complete len:477 (+) comp15387_c0_seq2:134-1564(+)
MVSRGFRDAGYDIVWIDDCWARNSRNSSGSLVPDPERWPFGLKAVADYVHSRGMKLGLYGDIGTETCMGYPGLAGHFQQDANQLAEFGIDAFKVDGCHADVKDMAEAYPALGRALNATGRPIIYSCSWPDYERSSSVSVNFSHVANVCNSWRIFWDVQAGQYAKTQDHRFDCVAGVLEFFATGSTNASWMYSPDCPGDWRPNNHPANVSIAEMVGAAGPGNFNDADMLPIGANFTMDPHGHVIPVTSFTVAQARSAFSLWAVLASPLMIGGDVRSMEQQFVDVWLNPHLIAVSQDELGLQGTRVRGGVNDCQVWRRQLVAGALLFVALNNGRGQCLGGSDPGSQGWEGPNPLAYTDQDCPNVGCLVGDLATCQASCWEQAGCNALNVGDGGCCMRACASDKVGNPTGTVKDNVSYRLRDAVRQANITVTWSELGLSPNATMLARDLHTGNDLGAHTGTITVGVLATDSAAVRLVPK